MLAEERTLKMKSYTTFLTILLILFNSTAFAERLAVSSDTANIRSGPGTNHDILWKVEKYHPLFILKKTNAWYHFRDFEEDEGWIHESLVNKTPTVITNSEKCNVRSGPGTKNKILFAVDKGIPFKILKRKGKWIRIQHADGDKGWIHKTLVW
jgi:SH3-like domain-containing protein